MLIIRFAAKQLPAASLIISTLPGCEHFLQRSNPAEAPASALDQRWVGLSHTGSPVSRVAACFQTGESARCRSSSVQSCQWPKAEASEESKRFIIVEDTPVCKYPAVYFSAEPTLLLGAGPKQRRYTGYHQLWIMPPYVLLLHSSCLESSCGHNLTNSHHISVAAIEK